MGAPGRLSASAEDYLKQIYKLQGSQGHTSTSAIAERMGVTPASVSGMLKKLAGLGLVEHHRYRAVSLTADGERVALEMIRHHRLLEDYLLRRLNLPLHALHSEADRLEHVLSDELEASIDDSLDHPTHDPHGDPIPAVDLSLELVASRRLAELEPAESATVCHVSDGDPALLRSLSALGLLPGARIQVVGRAGGSGPLIVRVGRDEHRVSRELAARVDVRP